MGGGGREPTGGGRARKPAMILLCDVSGEDVGKSKCCYARFISYKMPMRF